MTFNVRTLSDLKYIDIPNGDHTVITSANSESVSIDIEMINYYGDVNTYDIDQLGNTTVDLRMLVVKIYGNLKINAGAVFRPKVRKKGMMIICAGTIDNYGTISMTARGANAQGQNVYIGEFNHCLYSISAIGALGADRTGSSSNAYGNPGNDASNTGGGTGDTMLMQQTGGGGSGAVYSIWGYWTYSGAGAAGTSFSGGSGGGGITGYPYGVTYGNPGSANGGKGGNGYNLYNYSSYGAGGGAGNPGGTGVYASNGDSGTGGLLIIFAKTINMYNNSSIQANGCNGGSNGWCSGGSSGGGIINIFCRELNQDGTTSITANGGDVGYSGRGGKGTVTTVTGVLLSGFLIQQGDNIYILSESYYGGALPTTLADLKILKTMSSNTLVSDDVYRYGTVNSNTLLKAIKIFKDNNLNVKVLKHIY